MAYIIVDLAKGSDKEAGSALRVLVKGVHGHSQTYL